MKGMFARHPLFLNVNSRYMHTITETTVAVINATTNKRPISPILKAKTFKNKLTTNKIAAVINNLNALAFAVAFVYPDGALSRSDE